jgi:hypothetical protein
VTRSSSFQQLTIAFCLAFTAAATLSPVAADDKGAKPAITVVAPTTDELFKDLRFALELAGDEKGYDTLKETIETFLVGMDTVERGGVRIYPTASGLQMVISLPIALGDPLKFNPDGKKWTPGELKKTWPTLDRMKADDKEKLRQAELKKRTPAQLEKLRDASFGEMISNLWDLDVKTAPAPSPTLDRQIPKSVKEKLKKLNLATNERLIFGLTDGFLSYESGHVHLGTKIEDVRLARGGLPADLVKGHDLAAFIDGTAQSKEERKTAFDKAKGEMVGAITKGEKETEGAFEIRKAVTEHQLTELERFFVEGSRIHLGWNVSAEKKHARLEVELEGLAGTSLAESVDVLGTVPDEFAGVSKDGAVLAISGTLPLDSLRKEFLKQFSKLSRAEMKKQIADNAKLTDGQKKTDSDVADLVHDVADDIAVLGYFNGVIRCWSNSDGTLTSVGAGQIPEGARKKFEEMLKKIAARDPVNKLEEKIETEEDVEIHKLTVPDVQKENPEFIGKDGDIFMGLTDKTVWLASGEKALERMKTAIKEAKAAGPKDSPGVDLFLKFGPFIEARDKYQQRNPVLVAKPVADEKKTDAKVKSEKAPKAEKPKPKVEGLISMADLRKIALETFTDDKDTMTLSLDRDGKVAKLQVQFDETLIRYVGKLISKVVKENLADE